MQLFWIRHFRLALYVDPLQGELARVAEPLHITLGAQQLDATGIDFEHSPLLARSTARRTLSFFGFHWFLSVTKQGGQLVFLS